MDKNKYPTFEDIVAAFDYCREKDEKVKAWVDGKLYTLYPKGWATYEPGTPAPDASAELAEWVKNRYQTDDDCPKKLRVGCPHLGKTKAVCPSCATAPDQPTIFERRMSWNHQQRNGRIPLSASAPPSR